MSLSVSLMLQLMYFVIAPPCGQKDHRLQFERFLKDFFDEHERHLAENVHAFCVIL